MVSGLIKEMSSFQGCPYRGVPLYCTSSSSLLLTVFSREVGSHQSLIIIAIIVVNVLTLV